jgi:hypothetical protein
MSVLQVLPCARKFSHDWTECPYAHPGEKARRRDPRIYDYTGIACPNMKKVTWPIPSFVMEAPFLLPLRQNPCQQGSSDSEADVHAVAARALESFPGLVLCMW